MALGGGNQSLSNFSFKVARVQRYNDPNFTTINGKCNYDNVPNANEWAGNSYRTDCRHPYYYWAAVPEPAIQAKYFFNATAASDGQCHDIIWEANVDDAGNASWTYGCLTTFNPYSVPNGTYNLQPPYQSFGVNLDVILYGVCELSEQHFCNTTV